MKYAIRLVIIFFIAISFNQIDCKADGTEIAVDGINFPDSIFRQYISENVDKDKNGVLSQMEISRVKKIELWKEGKNYVDAYDEIDLKGINYFMNLKQLNIYAQKYKNLELLSRQNFLEAVCFYSDEQKVWNIPEIKSLKKNCVG